MIEYEKKVLLTEKEYLALMEYFQDKQDSVLQINHYFDTDYFVMDRNGITCRIREKDGKFKAVMKKHRQTQMYCSEETEMCIRDGLIENDFVTMGLFYQGKLQTFRTVVLENDCCKIMLDRNEYLGIVDYELEAEYPVEHESRALQMVWKLLSMIDADDGTDVQDVESRMTSKAKNKSERFFERKRKMSD